MKKHVQYLIIIVAVILSFSGILSINILYNREQQTLLSERDEQLFSLAYSVDRNIIQNMEELVSELDYVILKPEFQEIEEDFQKTGNTEKIKDFFTASHLFIKSTLEGIVLFDPEGNQVFSLNQNTGSTENVYTFLPDTDQDDLFICYDEQEKYSIALERKTDAFTFYVLFDLNHFYDSIIPEQLQESNWVVFYEQESGLLLQNHDNQDPWMVLTEEEIEDREDGYSIILKNQLLNQMGAETYIYPNYKGVSVHERIITLPQSMTQNGFFTIGISRDSEVLYGDLTATKRMTYLIMILLVTSGILISSYMLMFRQRSILKEKELEATIKEQELEAAMKEQELEATIKEQELEAAMKEKELEATVKEKELQRALEEAQLQNSIHQLQPHFLYNSLSSIREIVLESPEYAADLLFDFTNFLRACLRTMTTRELIPFDQELRNIQAYVNIEKMRLGDRLTVIYDIEERDFNIISLGIQPLVENAIRHGISRKRNKTGTVRISTSKEDGYYVITVADDGTGFDWAKKRYELEQGIGDSTGLKNLMLRYRETMGGEIEISSAKGKGTTVRVRIPIHGI